MVVRYTGVVIREIISGEGKMAQTEHLPIYKSAYDLCLYFEQVVRNFSRYHKYSLGADLRDGALPRSGYAFRAGFPVYLSQLYKARALRQALTILQVRQVFVPLNQGITLRLPFSLLIPSLTV